MMSNPGSRAPSVSPSANPSAAARALPQLRAKLALVHGRVQKSKEGVIHLMASSIYDRAIALESLSALDGPPFTLSRADEVIRPQQPRGDNHPRNVRVIPKSRDFH
jgi:error-prone DNA polymerase